MPGAPNIKFLWAWFVWVRVFRKWKLPSSARSLEAIQRRWTCREGPPAIILCDRGLRNRGVLAQFCVAHENTGNTLAVGNTRNHRPCRATCRCAQLCARLLPKRKWAGGNNSRQYWANTMLWHGGYSPSQSALYRQDHAWTSILDGGEQWSRPWILRGPSRS